MRIETDYRAGLLRIKLCGELDHHSAKYALDGIAEAVESFLPRDTVIDLEGLTFMDSSGIAVIVRTNRKTQLIGGRLWIENPPPQALKVLDASGIDRLVPIRAKREVTT